MLEMKECRKPDLHAPRYRQRAMKVLKIELFKRFKEKFPRYSSMTYKQFKEIIITCNGALWKTVIDERNGMELPEGLGCIFIGTCRRPLKRTNPNFSKSIQLGKVVSHRNWESDNKLAKIFYTNYVSKYRFRGREIWSFTATRDFKRATSASYPQEWTKYVVVENMRNIARIFRKHKKKEYAISLVKDFDYSTYNEFDMS